MLNKILFLSFYFYIMTVCNICVDILADENTQVSVADISFNTKNFFTLEEMGFCKDKVNFSKGWLGIFMENTEGKGILVKEITKGSPAAEAGLKVGDIITKINSETTTAGDDSNLIRFKKTIEAIGAGGIPVLTVSRDGTEMVFRPRLFGKLLGKVPEPATSLISRSTAAFAKAQDAPDKEVHRSARNGKPKNGNKKGTQVSKDENPCPDENAKTPSCSKQTATGFMEFAVKNERYRHILGTTLQRIGEEVYVREGFQSDSATNPFRLSIVNYLMLHPFDTYEIGQSIYDRCAGKGISEQMGFALELLDIKPASVIKSTGTVGSLQGQIQSVIDSIGQCASLIKASFSALSSEEFEFLYQKAPAVWLPDEKIASHDLARLLELSQRVDLGKLFEAVSLLLSKLAPVCLPMDGLTGGFEQGRGAVETIPADALQTNLSPFHIPASIKCVDQDGISDEKGKDAKNFAGDILFVQDTGVGKIVVGGTGTSYYYADAAVIIDLGGDDYYFNNAGASNKGIPVSVCIDLSGNDVYNAGGSFAQGTGRFGIGVLIDVKGNDQYSGREYAQGSCLFGTGLLVDNDGDDFYSGHVLNQGAGFFGTGLISDHRGNDVYFSGQFAQGVGLTKGFGALIDAGGNDFYFAGGRYPDFRDPGKSFQSMSQGMGMGIRPEETIVGASGGIGILIDQKGTDRYHGDYFSQGSGYYYALGFLCDKEGNDRYYASRYAQGAGIHSAIGMLEDVAGDDAYECSFGVSQGCGHDTGIGFLADSAGDDDYRSKTSSQGIGLEKGIGILADFYGDDAYHANDNSQGISTPSKTEEVTGIGILIDNQGDRDIFHDIVQKDLLLYRPDGGLVLNKQCK